MIDFDYVVFGSISFWIAMGIALAIAVLTVFYSIIKLIVDKVFNYFSPVTKHTFTNLPSYIKTMKLGYDKTLGVVTALAVYDHNGHSKIMTHSMHVPHKADVSEYSNKLQLDLMLMISKEMRSE